MVKYAYNKVDKTVLPKMVDKVMWGVYAPDGNIQTRSIADTKKMSMEQLCDWDEKWEDYKNAGFVIRKIKVKIYPTF